VLLPPLIPDHQKTPEVQEPIGKAPKALHQCSIAQRLRVAYGKFSTSKLPFPRPPSTRDGEGSRVLARKLLQNWLRGFAWSQEGDMVGSPGVIGWKNSAFNFADRTLGGGRGLRPAGLGRAD